VVAYSKPWLSVDEQIDQLHRRGVHVPDRAAAAALLREVGYYRLTGYLYPFRTSMRTESAARTAVTVLDTYRAGTTFTDAAALLAFDRQLRLLVIEGVERIEVATRTQLAHVLGRSSPFAHEDATTFNDAFTTRRRDGTAAPSAHEEWLDRVRRRQSDSDEAFVAHFRTKYDGRMPIWALIEILELGQVSRLYGGLRNDTATEIAEAFHVPTKKLMQSWLATINYVRNVAAHHARLFNRKLVVAPRRPAAEQVPLLAHLSAETAPKQFGVYSALAVMAHILAAVSADDDWPERTAALLRRFPESTALDLGSMGALPHWLSGDLWVRASSRTPR
jgi:abortive infection bacteriophage resistance protein